jgi:putative addiction module component (TIGR02574 family)
MKTKDLIAEANALPVEERAQLIESLLESLNPPDPDVEKSWLLVAQQRLEELRSGKVQAVPGEEVFAKVWNRFAQ